MRTRKETLAYYYKIRTMIQSEKWLKEHPAGFGEYRYWDAYSRGLEWVLELK